VHDLFGAVGIFEAQVGVMATNVSETLTYRVSCSTSSINLALILIKTLSTYAVPHHAVCIVCMCQQLPISTRHTDSNQTIIHAVYYALGIWHLWERSIARICTTGCFASTHFYWNRNTRREHTSLSNGPVIPFDPSGCDENSLLNCTNSAANKPHGKMTVKCDTLHLLWSLTTLHNYLIMPHCATQIFPLCCNMLHKLSPCATLYYANYSKVPHCATKIIPFCHTVNTQIIPLCHIVLHKLFSCATLY